MIHRAKFQNFKALRDVEVTFDSRLTVLVGPNGSGKTSVLQGIHWLLLLDSQVPFDEAAKFRDDYVYLRYPVEQQILLELEGMSDVTSGESGLRIEVTKKVENAGTESPRGDAVVSYRSDATDGQWQTVSPNTKPVFGFAVFAQLDAKVLSAATFPRSGSPAVNQRGEGLASALAVLALNSPDVFRRINEHLRELVPNVRRLRFNRFEGTIQEPEPQIANGMSVVQIRSRKHVMEELLFDLSTATGVRPSEISSGTLLILGILTLLYLNPAASVVLLDDIDHGLHPKAQMQFVDLLRRVLDELPAVQLIATSHSPYILDRLEPSEVRVTGLRDDGSAIVARLEDAPDFDRWKEAMTPGEFWSHFGDDWVKKLNHQPAAPSAP
jgi:predicted ATPase